MRRILIPALVALAACGRAAPLPPPPGVDSAGDPLPPWAVARIGTARFCGPSAGCAFSADGKSVVAACDDGFVRTFDVATGRETASFEAHRDVVKPEREGTLSRIDATFSSFGPPPDGIQHAAFSKDGTRLVTAGGPALRLWDVGTGKKLAEHVRAGESQAVAFALDGKRVRVADHDRLRSWDPDAGTFTETPVRFSQFGFLGMLASRDAAVARPAAAGPNPNGAVVTDLATGTQVVLAAPFFAAGFGESPDGTRVAVLGTTMGNVRQSPLVVCDAKSGDVLASTTIDDSCWGHVAWSPDGTTVAVAGGMVGVHLADASTLAPLRTIAAPRAAVTAFSSDGRHLLVDSATGPRLLDAATGEEVGGERTRIRGYALRWTEDGCRIAAPLEDGRIGIFDAATGGEVVIACEPALFPLTYVLDEAAGAVRIAKDAVPSDLSGTSFSPVAAVPRAAGPRVLAIRWPDGAVAVRDLGSGREIRRDTQQTGSVALSASGRWLASVSRKSPVVLTDVDADADVGTWTPGSNVGSLDVAEDLRRVVAAAGKDVVVLVAPETGPLRRWEIESRWPPTAVAISRDGRLVAAVVGWDVVVWDVDEDEEVVRLSGHRASPSDLEFSPDGTRLVSASADGTALVFKLPPRSR